MKINANAGLPKQSDAANNGHAVPGATLILPRRPLTGYWVLDSLACFSSSHLVFGTCGIQCKQHEVCIAYIVCASPPETALDFLTTHHLQLI